MAQKYSDTNYLISLLKTNLHFKSDYDRYNLNKKIKKEDMTDITTQLAHLYAISTKSNNNITIINNMHKDETNNEDLLKQIEELKKENKQLKKENHELKSKKVDESSDEEDKVSKKKYDRVIQLKNKYFDEMNEYKDKVEKLQNEIKDIKEQYNIKEDNKPLDVLNEEFSDDEDDDDDDDIYKKEDVKISTIPEYKSDICILQENLQQQKDLLRLCDNDKEAKKINKRIKKIVECIEKEREKNVEDTIKATRYINSK
tara:strand:+ start:2967 stop:3737 length:771 start_codon:yes stop_codon:yes gene_type:complete